DSCQRVRSELKVSSRLKKDWGRRHRGPRAQGLAHAFQGRHSRRHGSKSVGRRELFVTELSGAIRLGFLSTLVLLAPSLCPGAEPRRATVSADPGTIVRWSVPGTKRCLMGKRSWAPLQETCYYPIDLMTKPGTIQVSRRAASGRVETADISVGP